MSKAYSGFKFLLYISVGVFFFSCSKIDTTELGGDLIPAVDNVHTFDTTLTIITTQGFMNDSTRLSRTDNHVIGSVTNDPIFGTTTADLYLQLKPTFFPYRFGSSGDTIRGFGAGLDSVVLCLSFKGMYGDTLAPQHFSVYELNPATSNFVDSSYKLNFTPSVTPTNLIGQVTVEPLALKGYTYLANRRDSVNNQVRIKLSNSFAQNLYDSDSSAVGVNNAFYSDSTFKLYHKGFLIKAESSMGGNGLFYISLTDATTRLEVHYRKQNKGKVDTTYSSFPFIYSAGTNVTVSAHANNLKRDRSAAEITTSPAANVIYLQTTPGTYGKLSIPGLTGFPNSIIHRAEISVEQVLSSNPAQDQLLSPPSFLYLDLIDPSNAVGYKTIYYDLNPYDSYDPDNSSVTYFLPGSGIDYNYFGGRIKKKLDGSGNTISYYTFNISRYVQNMITKGTTNYDLRLSSPYALDYYSKVFAFNNSLAFGRVRVGGGNHPTQKMKLRIIYTKL